jgi:hypothetical protein
MLILTFLQLQLDRILGKGPIHTPGPKRPTLSQLDHNPKN